MYSRIDISKQAVIMLGDGALPVVIAIVRGSFGRHAWTMQLRHQSRSRKVSVPLAVGSVIYFISQVISTVCHCSYCHILGGFLRQTIHWIQKS